MRKILLPALASLLLGVAAAQTSNRVYAGDPALSVRSHNLNFTRLRLQLSINPAQGQVTGTVTHYFTPLRPAVDSFFLDGVQMNFQSVLLNGSPVKYYSDSSGLTVVPSKPLTWDTDDSLTITYTATPRRGLYFTGWNDKNNLSRKQVWSQGEATDNRFWIPMYDDRNDKVVSEMEVKFDTAYKVLSNGALLNVLNNGDGTSTWHYLISHRHAPYLIMLGIGKYDIKHTQSASGVPMQLFYYPEWKDRVEPTFKHSEEMVDFFEKEIGIKYPWESYSQIPVQDYMFGAMENTTATVFGDFYMVDKRGLLDRNYVGVNAHELAHQWFGDYVTAKSDAHQWLQESFATYYNMMFEREVFGQDYFNWGRRGAQNGAVDEATRSKVGIANSGAGGAFIYGKGAFTLNMLKYVVGGREAYNRAIKLYLQNHPYEDVDSHDLQNAFEQSTGMDLQWFWDEWIYRGSQPHYKVSVDEQPQQTTLVAEQAQELNDITGYSKGLFKMPVWIELHYEDNTVYRQQYWLQKQTEIIKVPNNGHGKLAFVLFDPNNQVLKTISFAKPFAMLKAQAEGAEAMLDRYDAIAAMRNIDAGSKAAFLISLYHKEKFYVIKSEVLAQLSADTSAPCLALFKEAFADADVNVRKAALANANLQVPAYAGAAEGLLADSSYSIVETALQKLWAARPQKLATYLKATKGTEGNLGRNVLVKWLELAYLGEGKAQYAEELVKLASVSYEFRTRANAMAALKRLSYFSSPLVVNLVDAILNPNVRLSGPAADLLKYFYVQPKYKKSITAYIQSVQWQGWQKQALADFIN